MAFDKDGVVGPVGRKLMHCETVTFATTDTTTTPATFDCHFTNVDFVATGVRTNAGDVFTVEWTASGGTITPTRTVENAGTLAAATVDFIVIGH